MNVFSVSRRTSSPAFTLIELLVVVAIIGVLTTLSVAYFNNSRQASRDAKRISDVREIQLALKMYYQDQGEYPETITAGGSIAVGSTNYLLRVPENPAPRTDNDCPDEDYQYKVLEDGQRYSLTFCLGNRTADLKYAGRKIATAQGIPDCAPGYIPIVGSAAFNTNDFCVMQYEAKWNLLAGGECMSECLASYPVSECEDMCFSPEAWEPVASVPEQLPITDITQPTAQALCESVGGHLMTNAEWMTMARDAQGNEMNESGARRYMPRGNFYSTDILDGANEYTFTDEFTGSNFFDKRTLALSSGFDIWDLAGNAAEMLDTACVPGTGVGEYPASASGSWATKVNDPDFAQAAQFAGPLLLSGYDSAMGNAGYFDGGCTTSGNIFIRGGNSHNDDDQHDGPVGIFYLDLSNDTAYASADTGFRCVR